MSSSSRQWRIALFLGIIHLGVIQVSRSSPSPREHDPHVELEEHVYRISGARLAKRDERPFQVLITRVNGAGVSRVIGSGAIYNNNWLITAAHIMFKNGIPRLYHTLRFTAGKTDSEDYVEGQETFTALRIVIHPKFDPSDLGLGNDIALVRVRYPIAFTDRIQPIPISSSAPSGAGSVSGWGYALHRKMDSDMQVVDQSKYLQVEDLTIVSQTECAQKYKDFNATEAFYRPPRGMLLHEFKAIWPIVSNTSICGQITTKRDGCIGDSGAPLTCNAGTPTLCGIFSQGLGCLVAAMPEIFTNIADFNAWILKIAGNADGSYNPGATGGVDSVSQPGVPTPTGVNNTETGSTSTDGGGPTGVPTGPGNGTRPDYDYDNSGKPATKPKPTDTSPDTGTSPVIKDPKDCINDTKNTNSSRISRTPHQPLETVNLKPSTGEQAASSSPGQQKRNANQQRPFIIEPGKIYIIDDGKLTNVKPQRPRNNTKKSNSNSGQNFHSTQFRSMNSATPSGNSNQNVNDNLRNTAEQSLNADSYLTSENTQRNAAALPMMQVKNSGRFTNRGYYGSRGRLFPVSQNSRGMGMYRDEFIQAKNSRRREQFGPSAS